MTSAELHGAAACWNPDTHKKIIAERRAVSSPEFMFERCAMYYRSTGIYVLVNGKWHKRAGLMRTQ